MKLKLSDGQGASVCVETETGHIYDLHLNGVAPLHRAPWLDEPQVQTDETIPLVERRLQGDFFCAPFGKSDLVDVPIHGMTANSEWDVLERSEDAARLVLRAEVMGARIEKDIALRGGALVQTHRIMGGAGGLPVAHHPMVRMADGGAISYSAKKVAVTPDAPLEPDRNWLRYPVQSTDFKSFPGTHGDVDLTRYPIRSGHEDFVTLIEAEDAAFGWTAVARKAERDLIVIIKDPAVLPVTMLWFSNGGRDYAPWNGRHTGVLGIEDGCAAGAAGHRAALRENAISAYDVPTALALHKERTHHIHHAIYAIPLAEPDARVAHVFKRDGQLVADLGTGLEIALGQAPNWPSLF